MKEVINTKPYESLLCEDCKYNVALQTSKLKLIDKLRPTRIAKKSLKWLCKSCLTKLTARVKK